MGAFNADRQSQRCNAAAVAPGGLDVPPSSESKHDVDEPLPAGMSFSGWSRPFSDHPFSPVMDVIGTEEAVEILLEAPGMDASDFVIEVADGALKICGDKKAETDDTPRIYRVVERLYGPFERIVELPLGVEPGKITATLQRGVLAITVLKVGRGGSIPIPISHL